MKKEEKLIGEEDYTGDRKMDYFGQGTDKQADAVREDQIAELVVSVQQAGNERGRRIYFNRRSIDEIKETCGEDFFLFNDMNLLAFVDPAKGTITITSLKGIHKNYL